MVLLPLQFKKHGYTYNLVIRGSKTAIYSQHIDNLLIGFEVIKIRVRPPRYNHFLKRKEHAREYYPTNEQWGKFGWTCKTIERAKEVYKSIN
jgi:hypothetical protein